MSTTAKKTPVKGGYIMRHPKTGRFVSVSTSRHESRKSPQTEAVVKVISKRHHEALKRLANR